MTVLSFTGVGTVPALIYFVVIRTEHLLIPGNREILLDQINVKVDNTKVHLKIHNIYNIKVVTK